MAEVKMPQLGETVVEGTVTRWLKKEGERVEVDEAILEISTDKVDSEIPAPTAGILTKVHVQEGDTVTVGALLAEIGGEGEAAATSPPTEAEPKLEEAPAATPAEPSPEPPKQAPQPEPPKAAPSPAQQTRPAALLEGSETEPRRGILSPLVRKLASENEVDLEQIKGTGVGGRITKQDVMAHVGSVPASGTGSAAPAPTQAAETQMAPPAGGEEIVPVARMRKAIADHMVRSHLATARAWNAVEVDLTKVAIWREKAGPEFKAREGFSLTWMPFVTKAVAQALLKFPQVNSTWNGDDTITRKHYVNVGIAVALENGLIVPVLSGADGMNLAGLARGIRDIADRARSKKLSPDEVHGGTFTITNPGPFGSVMSVPIINEGQAGILAFDTVTKRPVVVTDENGQDSIAIRQMVFISMSWDHRVIDGAEAAQFLAEIKRLLEEADFSSDLAAYSTE